MFIIIILFIILIIEIVAIEVRMKRKMKKNDKLMLDRLDQIINELQRLK